jgi:hypothetical protein
MRLGKCPPGVVCIDWGTVGLIGLIAAVAVYFVTQKSSAQQPQETKIIMMQPQERDTNVVISEARPPIYAEPVTRYPIGLPTVLSRGPVGAYGQIGILTGEGGSSSSAAPDRTILPLYGREIDSRRGRWNYYTRTDGANPVQVPIRYRNRVCDDDVNGCDEIYNDESVHVPSLGRSFKSTVYKKSLFV